MALVPSTSEVEVLEDVGYFFRYMGGVQFAKHDSPIEATGHARLLACASKYGLTIFSDLQGVFVAKTSELLARASKDVGSDRYTPLDPRQSCLSTLASCTSPDSLHISADQLLLAAVSKNTLHVYSMLDLGGPGAGGAAPVQPITTRTVLGIDSVISCFAWCAAPGEESSYLIVSDAGLLLTGSLAAPANETVAQNVEAAAWAPDSATLVYVTNATQLVFAEGDGTLLSTVQLKHATVPEDELVVESLQWTEPGQLLCCASQLQEDEEASDAFLMHLTWTGTPVPLSAEDAAVTCFIPFMIEEGSTPCLQGPYLHCAGLARWQAYVVSHRKAVDEHVTLVQLGAAGTAAQQVMVTDDRMRIALPSGLGGEDNCVVGLAMDTSCDVGPLAHPSNREAPDVSPTPLLLVAMADGALRFFCFGDLRKQERLTTPPQPLPQALPAGYAPSASAQATQQRPAAPGLGITDEEAAAAAPLPDSDLDDEDEEGGSAASVSSPRGAARPAVDDAAAAAAVVGLPDEDEEELEDEEEEEVEERREPAGREGKRRQLPNRGHGNSVGGASSESGDEGTSTGLHFQMPAASLPKPPPAAASSSPWPSTSPGFAITSGQTSLQPPTPAAPAASFDFSGKSLSAGAPSWGSSWSTGAAATSAAIGSAGVPAFGSGVASAFGAAGGDAFGSSTALAFGSGAAAAPAFGLGGAPAPGSSSTPAFGLAGTAPPGGSSPAFSWSSTAPATAPATALAPAATSPSKPVFAFTPSSGLAAPPFSLNLTGTAAGIGTGTVTTAEGFGARAAPGGGLFGSIAPGGGGAFGGVSSPSLFPAPSGGSTQPGLFAPPAKALQAPVATENFEPAASFTGPRPGFLFTSGPSGTGYYRDTAAPGNLNVYN